VSADRDALARKLFKVGSDAYWKHRPNVIRWGWDDTGEHTRDAWRAVAAAAIELLRKQGDTPNAC
jgi:hypothetical protein